MIKNFTAIDFNLANGYRTSICQVGLVRVEEGVIKEKFSLLVQPPNNLYWKYFTDIHGINFEHTKNSPTFDKIWKQIEPFIKNQHIVAHNGINFSFSCLIQTLEFYYIELPKFIEHDTYKIFQDNIVSLVQKHQLILNHPNDINYVVACAELFKIYLNKKRQD